MKRRTTTNKIICIILMLVLIIEVLGIFFITLLKNTILSKDYLLKELDKVGYYLTTKSEIEDAFKYYVLQSNLDDACVTDLITVDRIKKDTNIVFNKSFVGSKEEITVDDIKKELESRIEDKLINEYNHTMTESEKKDINTVVNVIVENYTNNMNTMKSTVDTIASVSKKLDIIKKQYIFILIATTVLTAVMLSVVYIVGSKNKKMIINKYQAIAFMTVGAMVIIAVIAFSSAVHEDQIQIFTKGITNVIIDIIKNIKTIVWIFGITTFSIGLILAIIKNVMMRKYLR